MKFSPGVTAAPLAFFKRLFKGLDCFVIAFGCNKGFVQHSCCDGPKVSKVVSEVLGWRFVSESMVDGLVDPVEVDSYQIEILIVNNQCGR